MTHICVSKIIIIGRHQAIIWISDGLVYLRIYPSVSLNDLMQNQFIHIKIQWSVWKCFMWMIQVPIFKPFLNTKFPCSADITFSIDCSDSICFLSITGHLEEKAFHLKDNCSLNWMWYLIFSKHCNHQRFMPQQAWRKYASGFLWLFLIGGIHRYHTISHCQANSN